MGVSASTCKINFEEMQELMKRKEMVLIHTLDAGNQDCLVQGTLTADQEVEALNRALNAFGTQPPIVIYGKNACDATIVTKYNQLAKLGFSDVKVYPGGLFEWLLLQDIYGADLFPTTSECVDILRFR